MYFCVCACVYKHVHTHHVHRRSHRPKDGARFRGTGDTGGHELGNMSSGTKLLGRAARTLNHR